MLIRIRSLVDYDEIYYTLDGTEPTHESTLYTGVFSVYKSCTIKAISVKEGWLDSPVAVYEVSVKAPVPVIGIKQGETEDKCYIYVINADEFKHNSNVRVHYTTDGTEPTENSPYFNVDSMIEISGNCELKISASADDADMSASITVRIEDLKAQKPVIKVRFGENHERYVSINTATLGASIYYTLDGTEPSITSTLYTGEFEVTEDCKVQAIAHKNNLITSDVACKAVTTVPETPVLQLVVGIYSDRGRVIIANPSEYDFDNISFRYTLDGSMPTETSPAFNGETGIQVYRNGVIKVIAVSPYGLMSDVGTLEVNTLKVQDIIVAYTAEEYIILRTETDGAEIFYTLDGTEPNRGSLKYAGPFYVQDGTEVRAVAYAENLHKSNFIDFVFNSEHVVDLPDVRIEHYKNNTYEAIITSPEPVDSIHYTLDGSVPTEESPVYDPENPPIISDLPATLKVVSYKEGKEPSRIVTVTMGLEGTPIITVNNYYILVGENTPLVYKEIEVEYE